MRHSTDYLSDNYGDQVDPQLLQLTGELLKTSSDEFFIDLENRLRQVDAEKNRLAHNATLLSILLAEIGGLAAVVQGNTPPPVPTLPHETPDVHGITDDSIRFGQSAAFQGPLARLGTAMNHGVNATFQEANRAGGVHGRRLELVT